MGLGLIYREINCDLKSFCMKIVALCCNNNKKFSAINKKKEEIESEFTGDINNSIEMSNLLKGENNLQRAECKKEYIKIVYRS